MIGRTVPTKSLFNVILTIACLVGGYFLYTNLYPKYTQASIQLSQAQTEHDRLSKALATTQEFIQAYRDQAKNATTANLALPNDGPDMANFINSLSELAGQSGVTLTGFQIVEGQQAVPENTINPVDITFNASGSYLSLKDFIFRIQSNLRLTDIYHVTVSSQNSGNIPILQYQIKLKTYYQQ
jgi:Tfp pilus assembly protein PilO